MSCCTDPDWSAVVISEFRQVLRGLLRRPAYGAAAVATLALVIGANAALFAAINATLFRPIPLISGDRTVQIYLNPPDLTDPKYRNPLHAIDLVRFRERSRTLKHIAALTTAEHVLGYNSGRPGHSAARIEQRSGCRDTRVPPATAEPDGDSS